MNDDRFDAVVVGGSFAGMAAAMQLARARRRVLVVDAGRPGNRWVGCERRALRGAPSE